MARDVVVRVFGVRGIDFGPNYNKENSMFGPKSIDPVQPCFEMQNDYRKWLGNSVKLTIVSCILKNTVAIIHSLPVLYFTPP